MLPRSNNKQGLIFIVSAPTGTGKTTLVQRLVQELPRVVASVSYTTRPQRSDEVEGLHYHFLTEEKFTQGIAKGDFLEYVQLYGDYYGTSKRWVEERLQQGKHVILVIDTQGAIFLKQKLKATYIFVSPPSLEELERRLKSRQTESQEVIDKRLAWVKHEMAAVHHYDYLIVNDDFEAAYQALRSIIIAEEHRIR